MSGKGASNVPGNDPRRSNRIYRYKPSANKPGEDPTADYLNLMGMIFSMCGLMMRVRRSSQWLNFFIDVFIAAALAGSIGSLAGSFLCEMT